MFTRKDEVKPHVPARIRAYGRARIEIAQRAQSRQEWDELWKPPIQPFAFKWGQYWKHCIEYKVEDFTAEVGFFIDLLGLPVNAFNENYAMFTSPDHEFYFAVVPAGKAKPTPADALRIQFMVADIFATTEKLKQRGIQFVQEPQPVSEGSSQWLASFQTPNGICMEIWGMVVEQVSPETEAVLDDFIKPIEAESRTMAVQEKDKPKISIRSNWMTQLNQENETEDKDESKDDEVDFDWMDEEVEEEIVQEKAESLHNQPESILNDDLDAAPQRFSLSEESSKVKKAQPVRSFQNAEDMLNHLNQNKIQSGADSKPVRTPNNPIEKSKLTFSPAPKKTTEKKMASVWDSVDLEEEYVDVEKPPVEEYHYTPIPLKRDD